MIDMKPRLLPPLVLTFLLLLVVLVRPALAHANLLQSTPEANARLELFAEFAAFTARQGTDESSGGP